MPTPFSRQQAAPVSPSDLTADSDEPLAASDADLLLGVRSGDRDAYGELFRRHYPAALRYARSLAGTPDEAFDLTAEAFTRILKALSSGSGPSTSFIAYLFTSIRRIKAEWSRGASHTYLVSDVPEQERDCAPAASSDVMALFEYSTVARAFTTLPDRWRSVLWQTEIHGQEPAQVARTLGLSPNAVSALAYRAREGLRQAYLTQHVREGAHHCRRFVERFGAHARGALGAESVRAQERHMHDCGECRRAFAEVCHVERTLHSVAAPLVLAGAAFVPGRRLLEPFLATVCSSGQEVATVLASPALTVMGKLGSVGAACAMWAMSMVSSVPAVPPEPFSPHPVHRSTAFQHSTAPGASEQQPTTASPIAIPVPVI